MPELGKSVEILPKRRSLSQRTSILRSGIASQTRDREIGALDLAIQALRQREGELIERQRVLIEEAAQAGEGNVSPVLEENIHSLDGEIVAQRSVIAAKMRERAALLDRFDEDRKRYIQLTAPTAQPGRR